MKGCLRYWLVRLTNSRRVLVARRKTDGSLWIASHPGHPFGRGYYFLKVRRVKGGGFIATDRIVWRFNDMWAFDCLPEKHWVAVFSYRIGGGA